MTIRCQPCKFQKKHEYKTNDDNFFTFFFNFFQYFSQIIYLFFHHRDVHVASALWNNVLGNGNDSLLKEKTRIVVMNSHYHFLHQADSIIYCHEGNVTLYTNPKEALTEYPWLNSKTTTTTTSTTTKDTTTSSTIEVELDDTDASSNTRSTSARSTSARSASARSLSSTSNRQRSLSKNSVASNVSSSSTAHPAEQQSNQLYTKENRVKGAVTVSTYVTWFRSAASCGGGVPLAVTVFLFFACVQTGRTLSDLTLTWWSRDQTYSSYVIYVIVSVLTLFLLIGRSFLFASVSVSASSNFHRSVFQSVLAAPINLFFDVTREYSKRTL